MAESKHPDGSKKGEYIVVARRYRPQGFDDLVGQEMVGRALKNAISTDRVGHAYLFTGARGVGKTSTARILSKALNCKNGPTETPCHECDICQSIAAGEDVDVLEIDGASNRGIDEIRQLRSNVSVRPSRSRFKVYIIDEVHMLTKEAFNALLKTLEEPPDHVKFIFCTTDPEKIPITVLSRCQRFDFSPVETEAIVERLKYIVATEGSAADDDALRLLARRAAGSMRDSQSLLEQLLSFTNEKISVEAVHSMLGTAGTAQLLGIIKALATAEPATALNELDQAIRGGVDAGQLAEQLLGCLRDLMALSVGGGKDLLLHSSESDFDEMTQLADAWGTPNLLAAAQILDQSIGRMRMVTHSRILLETAIVRIARLEDLQQLADAISQLQGGAAPAPTAKKKTRPEAVTPKVHPAPTDKLATSGAPDPATGIVEKTAAKVTVPSSVDTATVVKSADASSPVETSSRVEAPATSGQTTNPSSQQTVEATGTTDAPAQASPEWSMDPTAIWQGTIAQLEGIAADYAAHFASVANFAPNRLVVTFPGRYTASKSFCQRPERRGGMEKIASKLAGKRLKLEFAVREDLAHETPPRSAVSARQRERDVQENAFVQRAMELFSAEVTGVSQKRPG